jgi:hypothetical protein
MFLSDALMHFIESQSGPMIESLNSSTQSLWMKSTFWGYWKFFFSTSFQGILTTWGFCFTFNMMKIPELLRIHK